MYLRDALQGFLIKRINKTAFPEATAIKKACARFKAVESESEEESAERKQRILAAFSDGRAKELQRRDIRFITSAIGTDDVKTDAAVNPILDEIERRNDPRLFRVVFTALLAVYRHENLRLILSWFLKRHSNGLRR